MNNSIFRKNLYLMHKSGGIPRNGGLGEKLLWDAEKKKRLEKGSSSDHWENYDSGEPYTPSLIDKSSPSSYRKGPSGSWDETEDERVNTEDLRGAPGGKKLNDTGVIPWLPDRKLTDANAKHRTAPSSSSRKLAYPSSNWSGETKRSATTYTPSRKLADPSSNWSGETKRSATTYTPPSSGWGKEGSQEFKDNKKAYNQWYYQQNKDYWKNYYGTKSAMTGDPRYSAPSSNTASAMKGDPRYSAPTTYGNAMKGDPRYSVQNTSSPSYTNAMRGDPRYAAPTMRVSDLIKQRTSSISAGNDYIESRTGTVGNESLIENMWKSGASSIIKAGKSFLNAWKSGLGF